MRPLQAAVAHGKSVPRKRSILSSDPAPAETVAPAHGPLPGCTTRRAARWKAIVGRDPSATAERARRACPQFMVLSQHPHVEVRTQDREAARPRASMLPGAPAPAGWLPPQRRRGHFPPHLRDISGARAEADLARAVL